MKGVGGASLRTTIQRLQREIVMGPGGRAGGGVSNWFGNAEMRAGE